MGETENLRRWIVQRYIARTTEAEREEMRRQWGSIAPDTIILDDSDG